MTLAQRDSQLREVMDDPDCDPRLLRRTLRGFPLVNRAVSGWGRVYRSHVRPALERAGGRARLLDIGCGGGDVLRRLVRAARADGIDIEAVGIDPDPRAVEVARETPMPGVSIRQAFSADLVQEGCEPFDAVVSNHLLHHLSEQEITQLLDDSAALSQGVSVHSDIARSRAAYGLFALGSIPVAAGTLLRVDGLRSIRRSFTGAELAQTLPAGWQVEQPSRFRLLAVRREWS